MVTKTTARKNKIDAIFRELQIIKNQLEKFLLLIPEERLREYKNSRQIKKAHYRALKSFPPK